MAEAALPTYKTAANVLEKEKGSGLKLAGWTVLRTILIAPPMMVFGVDARQAFAGAALASSLISVFTLLRIFDARNTGLAGLKGPSRYRSQPRRRAARRR